LRWPPVASPTRTLVVAGSLAQGAERGGHCWFFGQWFLGLRRLGWEVFFLDYEDARSPLSDRDRRRVADVLSVFDMQDAYAILTPGGATAGRSRADALDVVRRSQGLVNVMGYLRDEAVLEAARVRIFLDIDPGYGQMWRELGLADVLAGHDAFVTIAANMGRPSCAIPDAGATWTTTRPPVVLTRWPATEGGTAFTTIATWRGPWGSLEYQGRTYGSRVHEFRKFATLPTRVEAACELALDIHADEARDLSLLRRGGWTLVEPLTTVADPGSYRRYIQRSRAEICVAKNMYVDTRGGWISDRSVCYLASGKPVLAQETGFSETLPSDAGLISFSTLDEAVAGVEEIEARYEHHSAAARKVAEEYFDSDLVLTDLLEKVGVA
jgi:hypothetical protein